MNKTVKNTAVYFFGTIVMSGLGFINSMLLNHVLEPKVYAMYGLLNTFVTALVTFISFGYDQSYGRFYYKHGYTQKRFLFESLKVPLILFVVVSLVILEPTHTVLNGVFGEELGIATTLVLLLYVFFSFVHRFSHVTARMEEHAWNYIGSNMLAKGGFVLLVLLVFVFLKNVGFYWLVLSFLLTSFAAVLVNLCVLRTVSDNVSPADEKVKNRELLRYGFPFMIDNVFVMVIPIIEKILIRELASWDVLSIFTAASIFQTVVLILTNTISNVWNPIVYKHYENEKKFKPILHDFGLATVIVMLVGLAACILLRRWLVLLLNEAYYSVYLIVPSVFFTSCYHILMIVYSVGVNINKKKTYHLMISPALQAVVSVTLCFILVPKMGLLGAAIASLASLVVSKTYRILVGIKLYNTGTAEWKSVLLCIVGVIASVTSMFFSDFRSDLITAVIIIITLATVVNKDIILLSKSIFALVKSDNKNNLKKGL